MRNSLHTSAKWTTKCVTEYAGNWLECGKVYTCADWPRWWGVYTGGSRVGLEAGVGYGPRGGVSIGAGPAVTEPILVTQQLRVFRF